MKNEKDPLHRRFQYMGIRSPLIFRVAVSPRCEMDEPARKSRVAGMQLWSERYAGSGGKNASDDKKPDLEQSAGYLHDDHAG